MPESLENKVDLAEPKGGSKESVTAAEIATTVLLGSALFGFMYFAYNIICSDAMYCVREQFNLYFSGGYLR